MRRMIGGWMRTQRDCYVSLFRNDLLIVSNEDLQHGYANASGSGNLRLCLQRVGWSLSVALRGWNRHKYSDEGWITTNFLDSFQLDKLTQREASINSKRYPEEFKIEAVKPVVDHGHAVVNFAKRLDITTNSLYAWIKKYVSGKQ